VWVAGGVTSGTVDVTGVDRALKRNPLDYTNPQNNFDLQKNAFNSLQFICQYLERI